MIFVIAGVEDDKRIIRPHSCRYKIFSSVGDILFTLPVKDSASVSLAAKEAVTTRNGDGNLTS